MDVHYFTYTIDSSKGTIFRTFEGSPGPKGDPGEPGRAATVTIGSVTSGSTPSVVNTGTETDAVLDFVLVPGEQGQDGESATISVGTTTTGEPGTNASVTNSGTASAAVLNFTIPRGNQGVQGPSGADGQAATIAVGNVTSGSVPSVTNSGTSSAAVFDFVLVPGQDGAAATISVGTVTTGNPGTSATVTNSGTSSAAVFDFTIPQGQTGSAGPGVPSGGTAGQILSKIDGTDYNTQWIDAPSGGDTNALKELGTQIVVRSSADDYGTGKTLTVVLNSVAPFTGKQSIDWGDGSVTDTQNSGTYTHEYAEYGYYTLTFFGNTQSIHFVDISDIYFGTGARSIVVSGKVSPTCKFYNIAQLNYSVYIGTDFGGWSLPQDSRTLGKAFTYNQMVGEIILPPASSFDNTFNTTSTQMVYTQSVVFPACTNQLKNVFPTASWQQSSTFTRIEMRGKTPPMIAAGSIPSTVTEIIVPWSSDHSVYNAYISSSSWSTYASTIYEAPAPTQPV